MINLEIYTVPLYLVAGEVYNTDYRQDYTFSNEQAWNLAAACSQYGIVFYSFIKNRYFFSFNANNCKLVSRKTLQLWENSFVETPEDIRTRLEIVQLSKISQIADSNNLITKETLMKKSYLYINMLDITELQKWYPDTISDMKDGTEEIEDLNRGYIKEDIASDEFILLDGIYYSVIDSENTKLKIVKDDLYKYKPLENFPKLESEFLSIKKIKKYNKSLIEDKIKKAEELVEQAEELADKFNLSISWNSKFGTYIDGDWNSSSLTY